MKNIWLINHYAYPPKYAFSTRHHDLFSHFDKKKYEITIFCSKYLHFKRCFAETKYEYIDNIRYVYVSTCSYNKNNIKRLINIILYFINVLIESNKYEKPDLVYASSFHQLAWIAGVILSKKYKIPFISEVRDLWPQTLIDLGYVGKNNILTTILRKIEVYVYNKSNFVVSLLPYAYEYINDFLKIKKEIICIPNAINYNRFKVNKMKYPFNNDLSIKSLTKSFICMYIGSLGPANNPLMILKTAEILFDNKQIRFIIIGDGVLYNECNEFIKTKNLLNVEMIGRIDNEQVPSISEEADIFLLPGIDTTLYRFGVSLNKMLTYACAAKPIITAVNFRNNFIDETKGGIITKPDNSREFANAIITMLNLSKLERKDMGVKNREFVLKKYDVEQLTKILENKIDKII